MSTKFKEMIYVSPKLAKTEVLEQNYHKGYEYVVLSYGVHPCCYVALPKIHPYYGLDYERCEIQCHGGLSFSEWGFANIISEEYWVLGWDYCHAGDYVGYASVAPSITSPSILGPFKKWTTEELVRDCINVIEQLVFIENPGRFYA